MAISRKRPPQVPSDMRRIIDKIYDDINSIILAVNQFSLEARDLNVGKPGDIRVVKDATLDTYKIEAFTKDGWASTNLDIEK